MIFQFVFCMFTRPGSSTISRSETSAVGFTMDHSPGIRSAAGSGAAPVVEEAESFLCVDVNCYIPSGELT